VWLPASQNLHIILAMKSRLRSFSPAGLAAFQVGVQKASQTRRAQADTWVIALAPAVTRILAEGYSGLADLAYQLDARGCPTRRKGKWSTNLAGKLCRRLAKLGLIEHPKSRGRYLPRDRQSLRR
jgi:hypothetical protein